MVVAMHTGRGNDAPHGVRVVHEILPEGLARPEIDLLSHASYLGPPE
jgi:hypothetical protein